MNILTVIIALTAIVIVPPSIHDRAHGFVPSCPSRVFSGATGTFGSRRRTDSPMLWYAESPISLAEMKASEMKKELESYGISTKSMFDRKDFEKALEKARHDQPAKSGQATSDNKKQSSKAPFSTTDGTTSYAKSKKENGAKTQGEKWSKKWKNLDPNEKEAWSPHADSSSSNHSSNAPKDELSEPSASPSTSASTSTSTSTSTGEDGGSTREEQYEAALEEGKSMTLSNLKKELKERGISTSSFFEKSDLIKAYANAIADGVGVKTSTNNDSEESYDPSYRDVTTVVFDPTNLLTGREMIIDITDSMN